MKKYRLIKKYPGSPELGKIWGDDGMGEIHKLINPDTEDEDNFMYNSFKPSKYPEFWEEIVENHSVFHIGNSLTENHPGGKAPYYIYQDKESYCKENNIKYFYCKKDCEKWANEQVIEKDYEILTYRNSSNGGLRAIGQRFLSNEGYRDFTEKDLYAGNAFRERKLYSIYSVKRLSDGEVFTVGDLCNPIGEFSYNKRKITIIEFTKAGSLRIGSSNYYMGINSIEHSKKPLFTTEDGVDIFDGKSYYAVTKDFQLAYCSFYSTHDLNMKLFSTKEAAESYILVNKPCLSLSDVFSIYPLHKSNSVIRTKHANELFKLTESKL